MRLKANADERELLDFISLASREQLVDEDVAALAETLAASGHRLSTPGASAVDVASTGGPSSLSTLLCPLFLRALGHTVPALGVPGRPAGGVDVLAQISGYTVDLSVRQATQVLDDCGYVHFVAGLQVAPLDARLFRLRQETGAKGIPALVVASLLAKKLAVGVQTVGLDARIAPHGNFGGDFNVARHNARLFNRVAHLVGIRAICFLTPADRPYQPYIGRGESILALHRLISNEGDPWLCRHADHCAWMAAATVGETVRPASCLPYREAFAANVVAQGGSIAAFERKAEEVQDGHRFTIYAETAGFPIIDLEGIRNILVQEQRACPENESYPDPAGVIILAEDTTPVDVGARVMTIRSASPSSRLIEEISRCVKMSASPPEQVGEIIHG